MKTIIVYGSSTGTTKDIADRIAEKFGVAADDVRDAADFDAEDVANYDLLIFGSSNFIVPSMIFIIVAFTAERRFSKKPEVAAK